MTPYHFFLFYSTIIPQVAGNVNSYFHFLAVIFSGRLQEYTLKRQEWRLGAQKKRSE